MELLIFLNYLFSIAAVLMAGYALWVTLKLEELRQEWYTYKKETDYRLTLMERQLSMSSTIKRKV